MKESEIQNILDEYKLNLPLYRDFCAAISNLLRTLLESKGYKYQMTYRVKDVKGLAEKLRRRKRRKYNSLSDIEDLAGIRIIFYLESEKRRFIKDLREELSGEIRREDRFKQGGYRATHVTVTLGEKRSCLSEYSRFHCLKCEIQLTSMLYHAWSEIEHDLFYKEDKEALQNNEALFNVLKKRLSDVMNEYITKANREFEYIVRQVRKIKKKENQ